MNEAVQAQAAAPKPTKGVPVELDRPRHFRFPLSVMKRIQEGDPSLEHMLYLGLKHEDPDLTAEAVADIVSLDMLEQIKAPLKKATGGLIDLDALFAMAGDVSAQMAVAEAEKKGAGGQEEVNTAEGAETGS